MMNRRNLPALIAAVALVLRVGLVDRNAQAADQAAHVHGQASLQLAAEGMALELYFESPAVNIVGFEHAPQGDAQKQRVAQAEARFRKQPLVRLLKADGCAVTSASVTSGLLQADHSEDGPGSHGHHDHGHSSFEVTQRLECKGGSLSGPAHARVMEAFQGIEQLEVEWLGDGGQGAATLTRDQMQFSID